MHSLTVPTAEPVIVFHHLVVAHAKYIKRACFEKNQNMPNTIFYAATYSRKSSLSMVNNYSAFTKILI